MSGTYRIGVRNEDGDCRDCIHYRDMKKGQILVKRQSFIGSNTDPIEDHYVLQGELGTGNYGRVIKAVHIQTQVARAIKIIQKPKIKDYLTFQTELDLLRSLDHPHIVRVVETFETNLLCYLVTELCAGGELFSYIASQRQLEETEAARLMEQIISAVAFCHARSICHRDLKPENCLLMSSAPGADVKLIDFGLGQRVEEEELMHTSYGTPYYIAPEVMEGSYDVKADCWSLGVILYIMLSGTPPFKGRTNEEILHRVKTGYFNFKAPSFKFVSEPAKDLISRLLTKDSSLRISSAEAHMHPWIQGTVNRPQFTLTDDVLGGIRTFVESNMMKKLAYFFIATRISDENCDQLKLVFKEMDKNGDGILSQGEIGQGLETLGKHLDAGQLRALCGIIDTDASGNIEYTEFIAACLQTRQLMNTGVLVEAFHYFDTDGSGLITIEELREAISSHAGMMHVSMQQLESIIREVDVDKDGCINYQEFMTMMTRRL